MKKWRKYAESIAKAAKDILPSSEVYVIGGVAEGRATVLSDIDVLIVVDNINNRDLLKLKIAIMNKAIDCYGLPWDAPVELHILSRGEAEEIYKGLKIRIPLNTS
ncbi:MAG: nucleotidyltransferase domain-containing protein [Desulfurococcaceae archaeon]